MRPLRTSGAVAAIAAVIGLTIALSAATSSAWAAAIPALISVAFFARGRTWPAFALLGSGVGLLVLHPLAPLVSPLGYAGVCMVAMFAAMLPWLLRFDALATALLTLVTAIVGGGSAALVAPHTTAAAKTAPSSSESDGSVEMGREFPPPRRRARRHQCHDCGMG